MRFLTITICLFIYSNLIGQHPASEIMTINLKFPEEKIIKKLNIYKIVAVDDYTDEIDTSEFWYFNSNGKLIRYELSPPKPIEKMEDTANSVTEYFYSNNRISKILETGYFAGTIKGKQTDSTWTSFVYDRKNRIIRETISGHRNNYSIENKYNKNKLYLKIKIKDEIRDTTFYNKSGLPVRFISRNNNDLIKWYYNDKNQLDSVWEGYLTNPITPVRKRYYFYKNGQLDHEQTFYSPEKKIIANSSHRYFYNSQLCIEAITSTQEQYQNKWTTERRYFYYIK